MPTTPQNNASPAMQGHTPVAYKATVSDRVPNSAFPYRVFCYSPGMGFDTGSLVYVGRSEFRTEQEAREWAAQWEGARQ